MGTSVIICFSPLWLLQLKYWDCTSVVLEFICCGVYVTAFLSSWSATISSFNTAVLVTTVWPSSLLAERLFIWTAEWYSVCCSNNFSSLLSPAVRRGFSQFVIAKVSPIWSAVYVLGYPSFQKLLCWIQSHTLESHSLVPTTICIPVNLQQRACEECVPIWNWVRWTKSSYIDFFCSPCHTY